ncbi:MAG: sulfotransferase [Gammaproteobacteria bacterium]|nr:sulfotransferase [Gammaproteobacteria bacterium]
MRKLYRQVRYGRPIVVVSGLPRSGTSMTMQMLAAGGLEVVTDGVRKPGEDNPKGYYEDERVMDLHKEGTDRSWVRASRGKAVKIISFLLKNLPDTNNYKVIFMRRELPEVLASQAKMLERRGEANDTSDEQMLKIWEDHLWKVDYFMKRAQHVDFIDVPYREAIDDPVKHARRLREFIDYPLDVDEMAAVVDPTLYRNRS